MNLRDYMNETDEDTGPHIEFMNMLNHAIAHGSADRKPSKNYHPSSMGGCVRNLFYQKTGVDPDQTAKKPEMVGIGESGTDRHERIQKWVTRIHEFGFDCHWIDVAEFLAQNPVPGSRVVARDGMETKVFNEILELSFKCDGLIRMNGSYYVLEIKTETDRKFEQRNNIVDKHRYQAACYSVAIGVDCVIFLYENRNVCTKKPLFVRVDPIMKKRLVVNRIAECETYVELDLVPPMTTEKKECYYCSYKRTCRDHGETKPIHEQWEDIRRRFQEVDESA